MNFLGSVFKFAGSPVLGYPPRLGEHTNAVLAGLCGYTPERLAALAAGKAVMQA